MPRLAVWILQLQFVDHLVVMEFHRTAAVFANGNIMLTCATQFLAVWILQLQFVDHLVAHGILLDCSCFCKWKHCIDSCNLISRDPCFCWWEEASEFSLHLAHGSSVFVLLLVIL